METRNHEELMMGYLYDELTTDEKEKFEERLSANLELMKELNELKATRSQISLKDKELVDPFMFSSGGSGSVWMATKIIGNGILKPAIGLAASISLLLILGYATNLSISTEYGYLSLSFGKTEKVEIQDQYVTKVQFNKLLRQMDESNSQYSNQFTGFKSNVDMQFASLSAQSNKSGLQEVQKLSSDNARHLSDLASRLQNDNLLFLEKYIAQSNTNQQRLIEGMLVDFSDYLKDQREEDLRSIEYSLQILQQNQELSTQETNQVLASIISKVNSQNN